VRNITSREIRREVNLAEDIPVCGRSTAIEQSAAPGNMSTHRLSQGDSGKRGRVVWAKETLSTIDGD